MSTYNSETDYELMELLGLCDLKNAQLILAQIVTINRDENTASITVLEECETLENESFTEVPFFYHCEYSTGTLEELVDGHKAFQVNDYVYCLFVPENGDQVKQFYIIGHFDIRKTRMCLNKEYLLVSLSYTLYSVSYDFVSIYDAETGTKIDLTEFDNLPGSPAKPSSFPCARSAMLSWYNFNFENPIVVFTIYGTIQGGGYAASALNWPDANQSGSSTNYTGDYYNLCANFNSGNALYEGRYTYDDDLFGTAGEPIEFYWDTHGKSTGITKYELGDTYCRAYWHSVEYTEVYRMVGRYRPVITITCNGTHQIWSMIDWRRNKTINCSLTGSTTEIEETSYSYTETFNEKTYIDFAPLGRQNLEMGLSWTGSATGSLPTPPSWNASYKDVTLDSYYSSSESLGQVPLETINQWSGIMSPDEYKLHIWDNTLQDTSSCFKVGQFYVYALIGGVSAEEWWNVTDQLTCIFRDPQYFPFPDQVGGNPGYDNMTSIAMKIIGKADTCVTSIYESLVPDQYGRLNLIECITEADMQKSAGLNSVINELYQYVFDFHNFTDSTNVYDLFTKIKGGPTAQVRKKKNI